MLVLTRRAGEAIQLGKDVEVTILAIHRGQVKIGIAAPKALPILRSELVSRDKK